MTADRHRPGRAYRYYDLIMVAFVTVLLCSNLISAAKRVRVGPVVFGAGVIFFPISYVFGDILTEVYGYARSRRVVWAGFGAMVFASAMSWVVLALPPDTEFNQPAWEAVFGGTPRIVAASIAGYWVGEFANSYTLAKMKIWTSGRWLWTRTVGSTIVGEAVDSLCFYPLAFWGVWPAERVWLVLVTNYCLKVLNEVVMTPVTYKVVAFLKRVEQEDYYDHDTDFNPFSLKT
jgi:queuosine precursor transporter